MSIVDAFLLGIVQGLTEFFPVSSSGHLVLMHHALAITLTEQSMLGFDVILHAGTLTALLFLYRNDWKYIFFSDQKRLLLIIIATIPGVIAGLALGDVIAANLRTLSAVGLGFIVTACILFLGERCKSDQSQSSLTWSQALLIGLAQCLALLPGFSRSGLTISAGRVVGLSRSSAIDFSFLMAVPIIAGATLLTLFDLMSGAILLPTADTVLIGFLASLVSSAIAIQFLRKLFVSRSLGWFAVYLIPVGILLWL